MKTKLQSSNSQLEVILPLRGHLEMSANIFKDLFTYLLTVVLGHVAACGFSLFAGSRGYSPVVMHGLHIVMAPLIVEHGP